MTVKEKLMEYTRDKLVELAKEIKLKGYSKLKKEELAAAVCEKLEAEGKTQEFLGSDKQSCVKEVKAGDKTESKDMDDVKLYCQAFAALYGIIPLSKALEIYNSQNEKITAAEFKKRASGSAEWEITDDCIIASDLDTAEKRNELISLQGNKEFYIPAKEEIADYANYGYVNKLKEYNEFRAYLANVFGVFGNKLDIICQTVYVFCIKGYTADEIMNELRYRFSIEAASKQELNTMQSLVRNLINNVRKRVNRGFTTMELYEKSNGRQRMFIPSSMHTKAAVGRNEPCPCGSGKKYKKCCGR